MSGTRGRRSLAFLFTLLNVVQFGLFTAAFAFESV